MWICIFYPTYKIQVQLQPSKILYSLDRTTTTGFPPLKLLPVDGDSGGGSSSSSSNSGSDGGGGDGSNGMDESDSVAQWD
jgi:hypothetical protein